MAPERVLLGPALRGIRERSEVSLRELAAAIGKTPGYVSRLETEQRQPSPETLAAICKELSIREEQISYVSPTVAAS